MELTPEGLRAAAALLEQQQAMMTVPVPPDLQLEQESVEQLRRAADDETRPIPTLEAPEQVSAAATLLRLFEEGPALVREAVPAQRHLNPDPVGRARSMVIQQLDGARLWLREALEQLEEVQSNPDL